MATPNYSKMADNAVCPRCGKNPCQCKPKESTRRKGAKAPTGPRKRRM